MSVPAMTDYAAVGSRSVSPITFDDQLKLLINYARNPAEYAINQYLTISTVGKIQGIYPKFFAPDQIRLNSQTGDDMIWEDGTPIDLAKVAAGKSRRTHVKYFLTRYKREDTIGYHTIEQSEYDERRLRLNDLTNQLMTLRTLNALTAIFDTTNNWPAASVKTATAWGNVVGTGGTWDTGTTTAPYVKLGLTGIRSRVHLATNGKVKLKDLILGLDPLTAGKIASSQEIHTYLAQQSRSLAVLKGEDPDSNEDWMLPNPMYGFKVIIEATPAVIGNQSDTEDAQVYAMNQIATKSAFVVARPGGIDSGMGGAKFSTVHLLEKSGEAMQPYVEDMGERQKLHYCRVSDMYVVLVAAPESGAIITSITTN